MRVCHHEPCALFPECKNVRERAVTLAPVKRLFADRSPPPPPPPPPRFSRSNECKFHPTIALSAADAEQFFKTLRNEALQAGMGTDMQDSSEEVQFAVRVWTCAQPARNQRHGHAQYPTGTW